MHLHNPKILSSHHHAFIRHALNHNGVIIKEISTQAFCKSGDNYSSEIFSVKIKTVKGEQLDLIVKVSPMNNALEEMKDYNNTTFKNEIAMYTKVLKEFKKQQITLKDKGMIGSANFYGGTSEMTNEIIILEDLSPNGYKMYNKLKPLSDYDIKVVLKTLAQFHSFSYAMKAKHPEKYLTLCETLEDTNSINDISQQENGFWVLGYYFSEIFEDIKYKNIVIDSFGKHIARLNALSANQKKLKYSVIIHGDCWINNILFKSKEIFEQDCLLIDYQLSKESSPVEDILHLIFNSTDYETRFQHWHQWLDFYYSQLQENLLNLNLDINMLYPKVKFYAEIKRYAKLHLGIAIMKLCFILRDSDESEFIKDALSGSGDLDDLIETLNTSAITDTTVERIRNRIEGLIDSSKEFGYLKRKKRRKPLKKKKKIRLLQRKNIADLKSD